MDVSLLVKNDLCSGCGFCSALCPYEAINLIMDDRGFLTPYVFDKCTKCSLCLGICPQYLLKKSPINICCAHEYHSLNHVIFGRSNNISLRFKASSGGLVTSLLLYAFNEGLIDAAVVTVMDPQNPLLAKAIVATSKEQLLDAMGSKYTQVDMADALRRLRTFNGRYAFVGLPCHIKALQKSLRLFPSLDSKILFTIGLFCGGLPSIFATKYILKNFGIDLKLVKKISYRGWGWPGYMKIETVSGKNIYIPYLRYSRLGYWPSFYRKICVLCSDPFAEYADISVGDPWDLSKDKVGESLAIVRSQRGLELLQEAVLKNYITIRRTDYSMISQHAFKKKFKLFRWFVPEFLHSRLDLQYSLPVDLEVFWILLQYLHQHRLTKYEQLWHLLKIIKFFEDCAILRLAQGIINFLRNVRKDDTR